MLFRLPWQLLVSVSGLTAPFMAQDCGWNVAGHPGPAARHSHAMAYDSARRVTVLFGGFDGSPQSGVLLGDTWEFDGRAWRKVATTGPSARLGSAMVYDPQRGVTVLFGGSDGANRNDTWEWDGVRWRQVASTGPGIRSRHAMAHDSTRNVTVLFGGMPRGGNETWEWNGSVWTQRSTTGPWARNRTALAYDPVRRVTVLFGGRDNTNRLGDDTWEWDGVAWQRIPVAGPPARSRHAMVFDTARGVVVLFGGNRGPYLDDTWEYDGVAWKQVSVTGPSRRQYHAMAYDSARQTTVLFGGWNGSIALADTGEYGCCRIPVEFGCETPHCSGAPRLSASICPRVGSAQFAIEVANAVPDAPGSAASLLSISDRSAAGTSIPCTGPVATRLCWNIVPIGLDFPLAVDATGRGRLPLPIPGDPALRGSRAYFQFLSHHPGKSCPCSLGPQHGFTSSKGLEVLIQ